MPNERKATKCAHLSRIYWLLAPVSLLPGHKQKEVEEEEIQHMKQSEMGMIKRVVAKDGDGKGRE